MKIVKVADIKSNPINELSIEDTAWGDWTETMAVNVRGPLLCLKHGASKLSSGTGSITLLVADSAEKASLAYRTSVGGLKGLMRATSGEFAPLGIRINAVCPVWDGMTDPATSEDSADAILFLASSDSSFITGTELTVDGGRWIKG